MEKQPQADSSQKSPASDSPIPTKKEDKDDKTRELNGAPSGTAVDSEDDVTFLKMTKASLHQDSSSEPKDDAQSIGRLSDVDNNETVNSSIAGENEPHSIISVDIQKSTPCDNKESVPQDSQPETSVSPEIIASVVTKAVVNEAALTISETAVSGIKITKDSSKVDAVVEKEINKISDLKLVKTDAKSLVSSSGDTKPMPNGDIDHSPVAEATKSSTKSDKNIDSSQKKEESNAVEKQAVCKSEKSTAESKDSENVDSEPKEKIEKIEIKSRNGVPGIIRVESITKREPVSCSEELETPNDDVDNKNEHESNETETRNENVINSDKNKDNANMSEEVSSAGDNTAKDICDNLTDSAKLRKENLSDSAKKQNVSESNETVAKKEEMKDTAGEESTQASVSSNENTVNKTQNGATEPNEDISKSPPDETVDDKPLKHEDEKDQTEKEISESSGALKEMNDQTKETINNKESSDESVATKTSMKTDSMKEIAESSSEGNKENGEKSSLHESSKTSEHFEEDIKNYDENFGINTNEMCDMTAMMTSQILTPEDLGIEESEEKEEEKSSEDLKVSENSASISATKNNGTTCDVAVGLDERKMARVAGPGGEAEEVDGQQASAEIEISDDATVATGDNLITNSAGSPVNGAPSSPTSTKSSTDSSKPASAVSEKESETKKEEAKPASAVSRSSIPEAIVYEPPERRKSAASVASEGKKDPEADKSQLDEKESEKEEKVSTSSEKIQDSTKEAKNGKDISDENKLQENASLKESEESSKSGKEKSIPEEGASGEKETAVEKDSSVGSEEIVKKDDEGEDKETNKMSTPEPVKSEPSAEKEKGEEDAVEKETADDDVKESGVEGEEEKPETAEGDDTASAKSAKEEDNEIKYGNEVNEGEEERKEICPEKAEEEEERKEICPEKAEEEEEEAKQEREANEEDRDIAESKSPETPSVKTVPGEAEEEDEEENKEEVSVEKESDTKDEAETLVENEKKVVLEEPKTLIEESKEVSEKETAKDEEEKDEDDTEKEATPETEHPDKEDDQKEEEIAGDKEVGKDSEIEVTAEKAEEDSADKKEDKEGDDETAEETAEEAKTKDEEDKAEIEGKDETAQEEQEGEEQEKRDVEKEATVEKHPKSPTKRTASPTKGGRRGVSPSASPPKALKAPPSPQKPQKVTSPKKKNGMLSPIKTPKTPGADGRKLPPIKAPVGLAPNPNLKNIRSKIGSFDNIRYKPGGGDKKVITKKLEWKATPKIGSLDHSYKHGKHGKSSKSKSMDGKAVDEESPGQSGDEAEGDAATSALTETLIKPDGPGSTDMPAAIAAES